MEWQIILALVIGIPIILFVPALVWAAIASGLYQVIRDRAYRRTTAARRRTVQMTKEPVTEKVA